MNKQHPDLFDWTPPPPPPPPPPKALARADDPLTSHIAAAEMNAHLPELEAEVLRAIRATGAVGATLDNVCADTGLDKVTASPRFRPLERKRLIVRNGTRTGRAGKPQTVWIGAG